MGKFTPSGGHGTQPETYKIITPFYDFILKPRGWRMKNIHGNTYTGTLPDKVIYHPEYGTKMVEAKVRKGNIISMSKNQRRDWIVAGDIMHGLKFWVIAAEDLRGAENEARRERMYNKLFEEPNCEYLLHKGLYSRLW